MTVAAGDLRRQARHRHQRIAEVRVALCPQPGLHSAHRSSEEQAQVVDPEALCQQPELRLHGIAVAVFREMRVQPVARSGRSTVADRVRNHDEVVQDIEWLAGAEQLAGEQLIAALGPDELGAGAAGAVQDQHGVGRVSAAVALHSPEGAVVDPQFGQCLARLEPEARDPEVALAHLKTLRRARRAQQRDQHRENQRGCGPQ
jgi:hypothetical protein